MTFIFAFVILFFCYRKPSIGLALLLQINLIRSLNISGSALQCFGCPLPPDPVMGAAVPALGLLLIILKLGPISKIKYQIDDIDVFFFLSIPIVFIGSFYSPDFRNSIEFSLKYLFLGCSFYFVSKMLISNSGNILDSLYLFLKATLILSLFLGTIAGILYLLTTKLSWRLTLPGVHPIPFSQLIGFGILISFMIFITNGHFLKIKSKTIINLNKVALPYLILLLLATNTRGVMLSVAVAIVIYLVVTKVKINKKVLFISGGLILIGLFFIILYIDVEVLFARLFSKYTAVSVDNRFIAYRDSYSLFFEHWGGIGTDGFQFYSILPYPHNFFLENIASFGVLGIILDIYFILLLIYMFFITKKHGKNDYVIVFLFALFVYFFTETMFSFTLWMYKGLYLSMGLFMAYFHGYKRIKETASIDNEKN